VTPHADYLYRTLRKARTKAGKPLFEGGKVQIACIGGGPASDVIGVIRYFAWAGEKEPASSIHFDIYDIELGWESVIDAVIEKSENESDLNYTYSFKPFDVSSATSWSTLNFDKYHLVTSSFFLSEIKRLKFGTVAGQFWLHVFQNVRPGCVIAMNDNNDERVYSIFDRALNKASKFDVVISDSEEISCSDSFHPVQSIITRLDHRPKRNGDIAFRVVKKR
jgi:hypothetical protein